MKIIYKKQLMRTGGLWLLSWFCIVGAFAQGHTVSGKVTDMEHATPLPGVNILVKGSTTGTVTDVDGNYRLTVPNENAVLTFSFIGYTSEEININGRSTVDVNLTADIATLSEVVVIGYGEKSRKMLTESIGTVSSSEINKVPIASPDAAIQGRVSGVQVTSVDGTPGSPVSIRIRGVGTVGNTQPLFVIDGVPLTPSGDPNGDVINPLSTLNPSDIENISILKDASSAAVYGVRAANGVVLITTKRGKTGAPRISVDSYYGVQNFPKLYDWNNTEEYRKITVESLNARNALEGLTPGMDDYRILNPHLEPGSPYLNINTDWQTPLLNENASIQNHHVSVSGGNDAVSYFVSAGYFAQEATIKKWDLERYSFRANADYKISKRFRVGNTFNISHQNVVRGMNGGGDGFLFGTANLPPFFQIYDTDNSIPGNRYGFHGNSGVAGLTIANQYGINEIVNNKDQMLRLLGGIHAEVDILKDLTFRSAASVDLSLGNNNNWRPGFTAEEMGLARPDNSYGEGRSTGNTQVYTNTLTFNKTIGDHSVNALAGIEYTRIRSNSLGATGFNFISTNPSFYKVIENQRGDIVVSSDAGNNAYVGYIGRLTYDFKQKYLLTATIRRDGTAHFAPENRWGTFPSFSAAWRVSEEPFFDNVPVISDLKIRASWGQLGNSQTASFPYIFRISVTPDYGLNGSSVQAPTQNTIPNREVGWETVESTDLGFDVSFFNNKINLLATYYKRNTRDFLYEMGMPLTAGFGNIWGPNGGGNLQINAGNVMNEGVELELGYNNVFSNGIEFGISGNLTTVKNKLTALAPGRTEYSASNEGEYRTAVGEAIGYFYGFVTDGIYQNANEAGEALPDAVAGNNDVNRPQPGDVRFVDINGPAPEGAPAGQMFSGEPDGRITYHDRTYLGKTIPDFFYGLNLNAGFKNFDLSILFQGISGVQVYNQFRRDNESLDAYGRNKLVSTQERWTGEGTSNSMPRAIAGDPHKNNRFSDRWVENAGFLRLRNLQLGYSIPKTILDRTKSFSNLRVYLSGSNLLTITEYTGLDPEVMTYRNSAKQTEAGSDEGNIPQPITIMAGIQIQF